MLGKMIPEAVYVVQSGGGRIGYRASLYVPEELPRRMDEIRPFFDERQKSWCVHCSGWLNDLETNRDHVPSKCLLTRPYPRNLPVIEICKSCNAGFSRDEEYFAAFLGSVLAGSTDPRCQSNPTAERALRQNPGLRERIEQSRKTYETIGGETRTVWKPEADRIDRVVIKNARGHAFFEYGEPMLRVPDHVWWGPLEFLTSDQLEEFESPDLGGYWPEVGSRMMTRMLTGQDLSGSWVVVQDGIYRYCVMQDGAMQVRTVISEYLATVVRWLH